MNQPDPNKQRDNQRDQPGSEAVAEALANTNRPEPSDKSTSSDVLESTPHQMQQEDTSLRELEPRSVERQWGSEPDIKPEADQEEGADEWYGESREMKDSFPDKDKDNG